MTTNWTDLDYKNWKFEAKQQGKHCNVTVRDRHGLVVIVLELKNTTTQDAIEFVSSIELHPLTMR